MAINLVGSSNASLGFGDLAGLAGVSGLTVSITLKPSTVASDLRVCGQWNSFASQDSFLLTSTDTNELLWVVVGAAGLFGKKTSTLNLSAGTTYRIVTRWSGSTMGIDVNGVQYPLTSVFNNSVTTLNNGANAVRVGETADGTNGLDGDYSEFAIHTTLMPNAYAAAYGAGYSPKFWRQNGLLYCRAINSNYLIDEWGGAPVTNASGTTAAHPRIILPRRRTIYLPATSAGETVVGAGLTRSLKLNRLRLVA